MISASFGHLEATEPTHLAQPVSAWRSDEPTQPSPSSAECSGEFTQPFMDLISRAPPEKTDSTVQPQPLHSEPAVCPAQLQLASSKPEVSIPAGPASLQPEVITSAGPALPLPVVSTLAQQLAAATLPPSPQSPSSVAATHSQLHHLHYLRLLYHQQAQPLSYPSQRSPRHLDPLYQCQTSVCLGDPLSPSRRSAHRGSVSRPDLPHLPLRSSRHLVLLCLTLHAGCLPSCL